METDYKTLKEIAETRLKESKLLYSHGYYSGSHYLAGYVIETALKATICKNLNIDNFKKVIYNNNKGHDFEYLIM